MLFVGALPSAALAQVSTLDSARIATRRADSAWVNSNTRDELQHVLRLWLDAAELHRRANNIGGVGQALFGAGLALQELEDPDSALVFYRAALPLRHEARDSTGESAVLNRIGAVFEELGLPDSALVHHRAALVIHRATGNRREEGSTLNSIGAVHRLLGRPDSALAYFHSALPLRREVGNREGEGRTMLSIGHVFTTLAMADSARDYYHRALALQRSVPNRYEEAGALAALGSLFSGTGQLDSAKTYLQSARTVFATIDLQYGEAVALGNLGVLFDRLGQADSSLAYFRSSLDVLLRVGYRAPIGLSYQNVGWAWHRLEQPDSALVYVEHGLAIAREVQQPEHELRALNNFATIYRHRDAPGDRARVVAYYDSAAAVVAAVMAHAGGDVGRVSYRESAAPEIEAWTLAWLTRSTEVGRDVAVLSALAAAERGRAQALLAMLRSSAFGRSRGAAPQQPQTPGRDMAAEGRGLVTEALRGGQPVLSFFVTTDTLLTWLMRPSGDVHLARTPIARDSVAALVSAVRSHVGADGAGRSLLDVRTSAPLEDEPPGGIGMGSAATLSAAMRALAPVLLPPEIESRLPASGGLVIIPHDVLGLLPFAALPAGADGEVMGQRFALRYAPSIAALGVVEGSGRVVGVNRRDLAAALVAGDPLMPRVRTSAGEEETLRPLPAAAAEARWVAGRMGAELLSGSAATEAAIRSRISDARLIHFATHGYAFSSDARIRDSFIALAPGEGADGLLTVGEVVDELPDMRAELVVLSACQTGLGNLKQAEGTVGMQRAFLARGAHSILVSLWSVSDVATEMLMKAFYSHWLDDPDRPDKAESLRRAQADLQATKGFEDPRYWAAFQLVGGR
jgi:tetratricopeptide (TPR) repeat protein